MVSFHPTEGSISCLSFFYVIISLDLDIDYCYGRGNVLTKYFFDCHLEALHGQTMDLGVLWHGNRFAFYDVIATLF